MAHAQKPDFVFRRNERVHLNRQGLQFSRLLAAEVCASAVVMLDTPCSEVVWRVLATHSIRQFPLQCVTVRHHISTAVYNTHCKVYRGVTREIVRCITGRDKDLTVIHRTSQHRKPAQSRASPSGICEQSVPGRGLSLTTSVSPHQYHSTDVHGPPFIHADTTIIQQLTASLNKTLKYDLPLFSLLYRATDLDI